MSRGARPVEHVVFSGWCQGCGELESWLVERGALVVQGA